MPFATNRVRTRSTFRNSVVYSGSHLSGWILRHHVAHVESFWRMFKQSVKSTHIHISRKHMQTYLDEFTFRSNHREMRNAMFDLLIGAV